MQKVNTNELEAVTWTSPKGTFRGSGIQVSEALGRKPLSTDLLERHPFDVEIMTIPAGCKPYPYHSHSMQWEFYHVISGTGVVRDDSGETPVGPGDAFIYKPGEAHAMTADDSEDLVMYVIADNPIGEAAYYPDSKKWMVRLPQRTLIRSENLDYFDGEE